MPPANYIKIEDDGEMAKIDVVGVVENEKPNVDLECTTVINFEETKIDDEHKVEGYSFRQLLMGWSSMFLAVMAGSLIGPMFKYLQNRGIASMLAASWRCQCMMILLIPLAIMERMYGKNAVTDWTARKPNLSFPVGVHVLIAGIGWAGNLLFWYDNQPTLYTTHVCNNYFSGLYHLSTLALFEHLWLLVCTHLCLWCTFDSLDSKCLHSNGLAHMQPLVDL